MELCTQLYTVNTLEQNTKPIGWGNIMVGLRLEKQVDSAFFRVWTNLLNNGLQKGDRFAIAEGMIAHRAANYLARELLKSDCDSLFFLDSDADVSQDFLERMRVFEPGWQYDVLQAFYCRRGWPPEAIWFQRDGDGVLHKCLILQETTDDVAFVGLHAVLIRRQVFERMLGDADPKTFDWFYYPKHTEITEDAAFSFDAADHGFRLGATTHVKAGHIGSLTVGWETYQDYLKSSGQIERVLWYNDLVNCVAKFTGEDPEEVERKVRLNGKNSHDRWQKRNPLTSEQIRDFYGDDENGYLYDLIGWNTSELYHRIVEPLRSIHGQNVLIVGPGLGTEATVLCGDNQVDLFDLPGILRRFQLFRLGDKVTHLNGTTLQRVFQVFHAVCHYDIVIAIDVIEHIAPTEIEEFLQVIFSVLKPGGVLYAHNTFDQQDVLPMHFDHSRIFSAWIERNGLVKESDITWRKPAIQKKRRLK